MFYLFIFFRGGFHFISPLDSLFTSHENDSLRSSARCEISYTRLHREKLQIINKYAQTHNSFFTSITMLRMNWLTSTRERARKCEEKQKKENFLSHSIFVFLFAAGGERRPGADESRCWAYRKCFFYVVLCFNHKVRSSHLTPAGLAHLSSHLFFLFSQILLPVDSGRSHSLVRLFSRLIKKERNEYFYFFFHCRARVGGWVDSLDIKIYLLTTRTFVLTNPTLCLSTCFTC